MLATARRPTPRGGAGGGITSEWPAGTNGFTMQLSTVAKSDATPESVDGAQKMAVAGGAADAAVLDSDLYSSLPPGNYVIYSGVYTNRKSAEVALKGLGNSFSSAAVVEVAGGSADAGPADQTGSGLELQRHGDPRCRRRKRSSAHGVEQSSPGPLQRLKPYFKPRPRAGKPAAAAGSARSRGAAARSARPRQPAARGPAAGGPRPTRAR